MAKKIDYQKIMKKALVSTVKEILQSIADEGLYKKQHLYITFATNHPDTKISDALKQEFEDEMTIILQYEFWDLRIEDSAFSVMLAFECSDEKIYVPYASLIAISDPSEDFYLEFQPDFEEISDPEMKNTDTEKKTGPSKNNIISMDFANK